MNYSEFASDEYVSLYYIHHFDGLFLNHIPLFRKLKWREVAYARGVAGTMSEKNKLFNNLYPPYTLDRPYYEAGIGIENIFTVFRVDGIWRLSRLDNPGASSFGVFMSVYFSF
jgi:hypothetical protein